MIYVNSTACDLVEKYWDSFKSYFMDNINIGDKVTTTATGDKILEVKELHFMGKMVLLQGDNLNWFNIDMCTVIPKKPKIKLIVKIPKS